MEMRQIRTNTDHHYISTAWLDALGYYETMAFKRMDDEIKWEGVSGIVTMRTKRKEQAIRNHCDVIQEIIAMEMEK